MRRKLILQVGVNTEWSYAAVIGFLEGSWFARIFLNRWSAIGF